VKDQINLKYNSLIFFWEVRDNLLYFFLLLCHIVNDGVRVGSNCHVVSFRNQDLSVLILLHKVYPALCHVTIYRVYYLIIREYLIFIDHVGNRIEAVIVPQKKKIAILMYKFYFIF